MKKWPLLSVFCLSFLCFLSGCDSHDTALKTIDRYPDIFPDYKEVTIPYNIAPLNFEIQGTEKLRADFSIGHESQFTAKGNEELEIEPEKWSRLLRKAKGKTIEVAVSVWNKDYPDGVNYRPFVIHVSDDAIDPWLVYRLIEPGYEGWNQMGIYQRNLSTFDEKAIVTNKLNDKGCVNCHAFAKGSPDKMMFHARGKNGGTVLWNENTLAKVAMEKLGPRKSVTYPAWHPLGHYIAFSSNDTKQSFLSEGKQQIEVYDLRSDLLIYDTRDNRILTDSRFSESQNWETFPGWSPDGKYLYYCVARAKEMPENAQDLRYSLCRVTFDETNGTLGLDIDTLYHAEQAGGSAHFPRISPDGKYLLYTESAFATFPIQHPEADLRLLSLADGKQIDTSVINSPESESYHAWSSNSRWIIFSSRRLDGKYTRLFIAHITPDGILGKPFLLPQKTPAHNVLRLKSYNIPELVKGEVNLPHRELEMIFEK